MLKYTEFLEKFNDMGKFNDDELKKGQRLDKTKDKNFIEVQPRVFSKVINTIKVNDIARGDESKGLSTLTIYSVKEYNDMICYLGKNNSSGYAIHGNELVSVFSSQKSSGSAIVKDAIKNGAKQLDCFAQRDKNDRISGTLYSLYSKNGFSIDSSMNSGKEGEAYTIKKGISDFVGDDGLVQKDNKNVVIFMKI